MVTVTAQVWLLQKFEYLTNDVSYNEKMFKNDFYKGWYLPSNETVANFVLRDLDLNFQEQNFQFAILASKGLTIQNITSAIT